MGGLAVQVGLQEAGRQRPVLQAASGAAPGVASGAASGELARAASEELVQRQAASGELAQRQALLQHLLLHLTAAASASAAAASVAAASVAAAFASAAFVAAHTAPAGKQAPAPTPSPVL